MLVLVKRVRQSRTGSREHQCCSVLPARTDRLRPGRSWVTITLKAALVSAYTSARFIRNDWWRQRFHDWQSCKGCCHRRTQPLGWVILRCRPPAAGSVHYHQRGCCLQRPDQVVPSEAQCLSAVQRTPGLSGLTLASLGTVVSPTTSVTRILLVEAPRPFAKFTGSPASEIDWKT